MSLHTRVQSDSLFPVGLLNLELSCSGRNLQGVVICSVDHHGRVMMLAVCVMSAIISCIWFVEGLGRNKVFRRLWIIQLPCAMTTLRIAHQFVAECCWVPGPLVSKCCSSGQIVLNNVSGKDILAIDYGKLPEVYRHRSPVGF